MRFLDKLELLIEGADKYVMYPLEYDLEMGDSFAVDVKNTDDTVARVSIKWAENNTPLDALNSNYTYDDVYADIDIDVPDDSDISYSDVILWTMNKLEHMGYDKKTMHIDSSKYNVVPHNNSDIVTLDNDEDVPIESDDDFDPSTYWDDEVDTEPNTILTKLPTEYNAGNVYDDEDDDEDDDDKKHTKHKRGIDAKITRNIKV